MARKILILSDDEVAQRQAAAALVALGASIATERSAAAGLERLLGGQADLAVIDTDLAGGGGWRVAGELQRRMGTLPVVLLAAHERRDLVNEDGLQATERVGKPIRSAELAEAVSRALGPALVALTPGPVRATSILVGGIPVRGQFRERPAHVVLGELSRRRASCRLELESGAFRARIHLEGGLVIAATCNDARLLAGHVQVAEGRLSREKFDQALAHMSGANVPLAEALRSTGAMDDAALAAAFARQTAAVVERACGLPDGSWSIQVAAEAPPPPHARLHPLALAEAGVRRAYPQATIRAWLERHQSERIASHPELAATLAAAGIVSDLPARLEPGTVQDLLPDFTEADLVLLFTLAGFGLVRFAAARGHDNPPAPVQSNAVRQPQLAVAERKAIEDEARRVAGASHYEVLGVDHDANHETIKRAFFAAAKRWHSDAFAGRNLDGLAPLVEGIFARVSEAHAVLVNPAERAEYDVFLERKAKGLPTDVAAVLRAEELFFKAQALFRTQRYADAEALFRQAVELNPAEAEFWAYLGATGYRVRGAAAVTEAREAFARARALIPRSLVTEYLEAQLEIGEGELDAAERRLRNILLDKPDHREALRDLRTLRERKEKESATGRGFFGTLWKRK